MISAFVRLDGFKLSSSLRSVGSWNYKLRDMALASLSDHHFGVEPGVLHVPSSIEAIAQDVLNEDPNGIPAGNR